MMKPEVTVVIPTLNRGEILLNTIKQVLQQGGNFELIVVDQTEEHDANTSKELERLVSEGVRYFHVAPPGVTSAKNFAIAKACSPVIIFIDDDVVLSKDFIKNHLAILKDDPKIGAVAGRVKQHGFHVDNEILHFDEYGVSQGVFNAPVSGETNTFPGGNVAIRTEVAKSVGGFDTRFSKGAFREESDFAYKVHKAGYRIVYSPKPWLLHLAAPSGGNRIKKDPHESWHFYRNELFFTLRTVDLKHLPKAIVTKHRAYCRTAGKARILPRTIKFLAGLLVALKRLVIYTRIIAKEVES